MFIYFILALFTKILGCWWIVTSRMRLIKKSMYFV